MRARLGIAARIGAALAVAALAAGGALADPVKLKRADPQPENLKQGLAVKYGYPAEVRELKIAKDYRSGARSGPPLVGFDYMDNAPGENALTSERAERVVAVINGYLHFDQAGIWRMRWHSNDGLEVIVGGEEVYRHDGRHPCDTIGWQDDYLIEEPGWYEVEAVWFQRLNTSCLMMEWQPPGGAWEWTPNEATGYN